MKAMYKNELETATAMLQKSPIIENPSELIQLKIDVFKQLEEVALRNIKDPIESEKIVSQIIQKHYSATAAPSIPKVAKVNGRYFWGLGSPGFPSIASLKMNENEVSRFVPGTSNTGLRSILFAITKKCPLNCEHCFEWDNLNKNPDLPVNEVIEIIHKYQDYGTTQMMLTGGEPMLRVNDLYKILQSTKPGTDFWIITSGLGLNQSRAKQLKESGLTGVLVSLDHYIEEKHDDFRGFTGAFKWVSQAIANAKESGLVTGLSLCSTQSFTNEENLKSYMDLAHEMGVAFVQILEPRATGRYQGKDVTLSKDNIELLEKIYLEYNSSSSYKSYPIINYLGYHQRRLGCFGGGDRFFYIDTDGDAHLCPFCENKVGKALNFTAKDMINLLGQYSCADFNKSSI